MHTYWGEAVPKEVLREPLGLKPLRSADRTLLNVLCCCCLARLKQDTILNRHTHITVCRCESFVTLSLLLHQVVEGMRNERPACTHHGATEACSLQHIAPVCQFAACIGQWVIVGCQHLAQHTQVAGQVPVVCQHHKLPVGFTVRNKHGQRVVAA